MPTAIMILVILILNIRHRDHILQRRVVDNTEYSEAKRRGVGTGIEAIYFTSSFMSASVSLTPTVVLVR
jgi:hypothetical protein